MKKIRIFMFLVLSLLLVNCGKEEKKVEESNVEKTEVVETKEEKVDDVVIENEKIKFSDKAYKLFEEFSNSKKDIIEKLKSANKDEIVGLYSKYTEDTKNILDNINSETFEFLESMYSHKNEEENFTEKDVEDLNKLLKKYDLTLYDAGEGITEINGGPGFYYNIFKDYVSDDYKEYLQFITMEEEEPYQADAVIMISFEDLGERIITLENFLNKYPNSTLKDEVQEKLKWYRLNYLLGADSTPTMEENAIIKIYLEEYNRFMKKYPNSPTVELIKYFIDNHKDPNISEKIFKKIGI